MKIYYDEEHDACAVEFNKDDVLFMYQGEEGLVIDSCDGGKPEIIEKQLLFSLEEED